MKNNIVMLAFASILTTTATDWAVAAEAATEQNKISQQSNEPLRETDSPMLNSDKKSVRWSV